MGIGKVELLCVVLFLDVFLFLFSLKYSYRIKTLMPEVENSLFAVLDFS